MNKPMTYTPLPRRGDTQDIHLVKAFHTKFGQPAYALPTLPSMDYLEFRLKRLRAELSELEDAVARRDLLDVADALVDLSYLTLGTAVAAGLPWTQLFDVVHQANMTKVSVNSAAGSKFGSVFDIVKPEGWEPPEPSMAELLRRAGWEGA